MVPIDNLVIADRADEKDNEPSLILSLREEGKSRRPTGGNLLVSFRCGDRYLFVCDMDCIFEESFEFYLLSASFDVLDNVSLGLAYASGDFHSLEIVSSDRLQFFFFADEKWELSIRDQRTLRSPFVLGPFFSPVSHPFSFFSYLSLQKVQTSSRT